LTQLQELKLDTNSDIIIAEQLVSILTSCKQLTTLDLNGGVFQPQFDALLTHAPQLTSLTSGYLYPEEDRSASPCSWKELAITHQAFRAETVVRIPTGSLTRFVFTDVVFPSTSPTLEFRSMSDNVDAQTMPEVIHSSLMNLMRSPAWQQCGPQVHVRLIGEQYFDPPELPSFIRALALLAGKEVKLSLDMPDIPTGASEVQQLGVTFGSSLKQLVLEDCDLESGFWPAVWSHLPGLQHLVVGDSVCGAIGVRQISSFCKAATRPLQLDLGPEVYEEMGAEGHLEGEGRVRGAPQVTVTETFI
jgi:hypothetical protein